MGNEEIFGKKYTDLDTYSHYKFSYVSKDCSESNASFYWPTASEADFGGMAGETEVSQQYSIKFYCHVTDGTRDGLAKWFLTCKCI